MQLLHQTGEICAVITLQLIYASFNSYLQNNLCDFGPDSSSTPRVIAPSATNYFPAITANFDTEVSGFDPTVLSGLTESMTIVVDEQTILYLAYSESSNHYLTKV